MSKEKHGLIGSIIKKIMIIVFTLIGACLVVLGAVYRAKGWDIGVSEGKAYDVKWLSICNIVFGACLLTSPFFLKKDREGLSKVIQIIMVIIFTAIGVALVAGGAVAIAKNYDVKKWISICNIVFGCCLLTSGYFLKKE